MEGYERLLDTKTTRLDLTVGDRDDLLARVGVDQQALAAVAAEYGCRRQASANSIRAGYEAGFLTALELALP